MSNLFSGSFPLLTYRNLDAQVTGSVVKAYTGGVFDLAVSNSNAAARYLKLYDKATAPTETDTPIRTYYLPPLSLTHLSIPDGIKFITGISLRASTGVADADTGAPTTNDVVVNIGYQ
jgi:hypothetical protein